MDEIKHNNYPNKKYGFYSSIALLILLLFPFYDDGVRSYSLLSMGYGKVIALLLITIAAGFYIKLNKNYMNLLISFAVIGLLYTILDGTLQNYSYNFSTISLMLISFSTMCYFGFTKKSKK